VTVTLREAGGERSIALSALGLEGTAS